MINLLMNYLSETDAEQLLEDARLACENTYSPYSNFPVGAAVLTNDGHVFKGSNIENASYSITVCAERTALGNAISSGHRDIKAIAVYTPQNNAAPCGACRQFIIEFGKDIIIVFSDGQKIIQKTIDELLPYAFTKAALGK
jgi:cytidine deaminase